MKYLIASVLFCFASIAYSFEQEPDPGTQPKGKPFVELQGEIVEVQDAIADINAEIDNILASIDTIEGQIAALEAELTTLQVDVTTNADKIAVIEADLVVLNAALDTKQNIVTGTCPAGEYMVSVNAGVNDGQVVCAVAGGALDIVTLNAFKFAPGNASPYGHANCPVGYLVTGGGGSWYNGLRQSEPTTATRWTVKGIGGGPFLGFGAMVIKAVCIRN